MTKTILKKIISVSQKKDLDFKDLVKEAIKSGVPVYNVWILIQARFEQLRLNKTDFETNTNGWINKSQEAKINELYEEINRLRRVKLIDFPNIDKKWMHLFTVTAILASIIVITLFLRSQHYVGKSEEFGYNIEVLQGDTSALANAIRVHQFRVDSLINLLSLERNKVIVYQEEISDYRNKLSSLTTEQNRLNNQITELTRSISNANDEIMSLKNNYSRVNGEKKHLEQEVNTLRNEMRRLDRINFLQGYSVTTINNCRTRNTTAERLYFNTNYPLKIREFTVNSRRSGRVTFSVYDNNTRRTQTKTVHLRQGNQTIILGFDITIGNNHYITFSGGQLTALRECFNFPFGVNNLIRFTRGSSSLYPPFYDIVVSANVPQM